MTETAKRRPGPAGAGKGRIRLENDAAGHLRAAFEQMDLLLSARRTEAGLDALVCLLHHLRAVRRLTA